MPTLVVDHLLTKRYYIFALFKKVKDMKEYRTALLSIFLLSSILPSFISAYPIPFNQLLFSSPSNDFNSVTINDSLKTSGTNPPISNLKTIQFRVYSNVSCSTNTSTTGIVTLTAPAGGGYPLVNGANVIGLRADSLYTIISNAGVTPTSQAGVRFQFADASPRYNSGSTCACRSITCTGSTCSITNTTATTNITANTKTGCALPA